MSFTLQIFHTSDFESGIDAASTSPETSDAVRFSALLNRLRTNYRYRQHWELQLNQSDFFSLKCPLIFTHSESTP
ncbi:hypothetical protein [Nostoc sp.]|uniref:hypothetical protein n=1 Tax=Nostoc sp. TaxID=1180 RepID=UPI002FF8EB4D